MQNPFGTLGLPLRFDLESSEIERRYREVQRVVHPDRHVGAASGARRAALSGAVTASEAYRTVRDEVSRAEALLAALGHRAAPASANADPELLLAMMELRETLQEARAAHDARAVEALRLRVAALRDGTLTALRGAFDARKLDDAVALVGRLRYYRRFLDEVAVFEDEDPQPSAR